jgi:hypothetical protein
MDIARARAEVHRLLDADLPELTGGGALSVLPPASVSDWNLPDGDRAALQTFGLPPQRDDGLFSVYGQFEPAARTDGLPDAQPYYVLGRFGISTIAARLGSGTVVAIPKYSAEEIHPQLRQTHGPFIAVEEMNSTVTALVALSWRYYRLVPIIASQFTRAGNAERAAWKTVSSVAEGARLPDFFQPVRSLCQEIFDGFAAADPTAVAQPNTFWHEAIMEP